MLQRTSLLQLSHQPRARMITPAPAIHDERAPVTEHEPTKSGLRRTSLRQRRRPTNQFYAVEVISVQVRDDARMLASLNETTVLSLQHIAVVFAP